MTGMPKLSLNGWTVEWIEPRLHMTSPDGEIGTVELRATNPPRENRTLPEFRAGLRTHGWTKTCEVFWKLRAEL